MCDHAKCYSEGHAINALSFLTESGKIFGGGLLKIHSPKWLGLIELLR